MIGICMSDTASPLLAQQTNGTRIVSSTCCTPCRQTPVNNSQIFGCLIMPRIFLLLVLDYLSAAPHKPAVKLSMPCTAFSWALGSPKCSCCSREKREKNSEVCSSGRRSLSIGNVAHSARKRDCTTSWTVWMCTAVPFQQIGSVLILSTSFISLSWPLTHSRHLPENAQTI